MKKTIQIVLFASLSFASLGSVASGQATPAAVGAAPYQGFQLPKAKGSLGYAVSASESLTTGYYQSQNRSNTAEFTNISGDLAYLSSSAVHPFSLIYSGGFLGNTSGQRSSFFQNLAASQVLLKGPWNFVVSDSLNYLPNTPTVGVSGIAGVGDLGVPPVQIGPVLGQGVLIENAKRFSNTTVASVERRITGKTFVQVSGSLSLQRFIGSGSEAGLNSTQKTASIGPTHRIDARNTVGANYSYSSYTYARSQYGFVSQGANLTYHRLWSRKLSTSLSLGPQRTSSSNGAISKPSTNLAANLAANYAGEGYSGSLTYFRGVNNGSGAIQGALSDSVSASAGRMFGRSWTGSVLTNYTRTTSLPLLQVLPFSTHTVVGGVQVSRAISRSFSAYASYTALKQSFRGTGAALGVFSGLSQIVGVGLTYAPGSKHFGRL